LQAGTWADYEEERISQAQVTILLTMWRKKLLGTAGSIPALRKVMRSLSAIVAWISWWVAEARAAWAGLTLVAVPPMAPSWNYSLERARAAGGRMRPAASGRSSLARGRPRGRLAGITAVLRG
jgi:hypothetical protein